MKHLILLSVFFAMPALASLDGLWVGTGSWSYEGSDVPCRMKLNYRETWKDEKGTEIYLITGELSKRP